MSQAFKTVDLFAGPGGLAEGFAAIKDDKGKRPYQIALSVEKEPSAFATLRLRSFFRQFEDTPETYYAYISGKISRDQLVAAHPREWKAASDETAMLELGTEKATAWLDPILDGISASASIGTILIGGPPCQAYSLVGRARNRGIQDYVPEADHRHFLYREYIRILQRLEPVAFVMENVKGMLSAKISGESMIDRIVEDLKSAGGKPDSYVLLPLVANQRSGHVRHVIRVEDFGIPQARHRVILMGIRADVFSRSGIDPVKSPSLTSRPTRPSVASVLAGMPNLRSGLSKIADSPDAWRQAVVRAFKDASTASRRDGGWLTQVAKRLVEYSREFEAATNLPPRSSTEVTPLADNFLAAWLADDRLLALPNHESRGHMQGDLARYAFAATFAEVFDRSPKADEFPKGLAPNHRNWTSGKFADRFRVQTWNSPSTTVTSHISKDGHYFIHPDPKQCRSLTVREAARLQTFPDNYFFEGNRTQQYVQVGNAVPPLLAKQIGELLLEILRMADAD
ncbi:DNA cytosine methyltransferase [Sphingosinithalassobacter portus]|uniref:DNA cytosine methyltransferase n=1 Tax=Stakelama portus TaxID=2676234 RepID=UPI000D6E9477|nr:DNA cytosine methyltransferase [Sphingosinithalassobacter portus]